MLPDFKSGKEIGKLIFGDTVNLKQKKVYINYVDFNSSGQ
jgi:hypothetical protein